MAPIFILSFPLSAYMTSGTGAKTCAQWAKNKAEVISNNNANNNINNATINHLDATRPTSSNASFENNLQMSVTRKNDLRGELDQIIAERNQVNTKQNPQDTRNMFEMPVESNNKDMKIKYERIEFIIKCLL